MIKDCTHPSLIALLYNEIDALDALDALELLYADPPLPNMSHEIHDTHRIPSTDCIKPHLDIIHTIPNHSMQY